MKTTLKILIPFLILSFNGFAQPNNKYLIRFKDRANTPYAISNPSIYLSQKALQRRTKQHINITDNDLPVNPNYIDSIIHLGVKVLYATKWLNGVVVQIDDTTNVLRKINNFPFVGKTNSVGKRIRGSSLPPKENNEQHVALPFTISNKRVTSVYNYGLAYNQIHMLNGEPLHDNGYRGQGITIALLDAGFNSADVLPAFDSLWANHQILGVKDFVSFDDNGVFQDDPHGMEVLSTIGGNIPGKLIGTAPKAHFWLLRSENAATEYIIEEVNYARAAEFADSVGVDIIHSSLGYTTFDDSTEDHHYKDMNGKTAYCSIAGHIAASKGILVTSSAGNEGSSSWHYISAPADGDSVMAVGAVDSNGSVTGFSSRGPSADGRVKPNVMAQGASTAIQYTNGTVGGGNGTSFSGPVLAGMAASLWSSLPTLGNMEIYNYIQLSASLYYTPNNDMGYGIPNFGKAYYNATGSSLSDIPLNNNKTLTVGFVNTSINEGLSFLLNSDTIQSVQIEFYAITGKKVYSTTVVIQQGANPPVKIVDSPVFSSGMYIVRISFSQNPASYTYKAIKY